VVQSAFGFTVVACGALFVTFAGLLARFGEAGAAAVPELPAARCRWFAAGLGVACALAVLIFGLNFAAEGASELFVAAAGAVLLPALALTAWALYRAAAGEGVAAHAAPAQITAPGGWPLVWRRAARGVVWAGAAGVVAFGVLLPLQANLTCCSG